MKASDNPGRPLATKYLWASKRSLVARGRPWLYVTFIKISQRSLLGQQKIFGGQRSPRIICGLHYNLTTKTNIIRYSFVNLHPGTWFTVETRSTCCICSERLKIFWDLKIAPNYIEVVEGTLNNEFLEKNKDCKYLGAHLFILIFLGYYLSLKLKSLVVQRLAKQYWVIRGSSIEQNCRKKQKHIIIFRDLFNLYSFSDLSEPVKIFSGQKPAQNNNWELKGAL